MNVVLYLLQHGADPNASMVHPAGASPLHFAVAAANKDVADLLIRFGATEVSAPSTGTPTELARTKGDDSIIEAIKTSKKVQKELSKRGSSRAGALPASTSAPALANPNRHRDPPSIPTHRHSLTLLSQSSALMDAVGLNGKPVGPPGAARGSLVTPPPSPHSSSRPLEEATDRARRCEVPLPQTPQRPHPGPLKLDTAPLMMQQQEIPMAKMSVSSSVKIHPGTGPKPSPPRPHSRAYEYLLTSPPASPSASPPASRKSSSTAPEGGLSRSPSGKRLNSLLTKARPMTPIQEVCEDDLSSPSSSYHKDSPADSERRFFDRSLGSKHAEAEAERGGSEEGREWKMVSWSRAAIDMMKLVWSLCQK
jgi:hypothetical protein